MTIFYLGPTARVTDQTFDSLWPVQRSFILSELSYPHTLLDRPVEMVVASTQVRVCSGGALSLSVWAAVTGWPLFDRPAVTGAGLLVAILAGLVVAAARRVRRRPLEVRAMYRGQMVCVYTTTNRQTFGQVRRALLRALERQRDLL
jgi:hypothetical protein